MKPVTYDFDVITDAPRITERPKRRPPEQAEHPPQADAEEQRRSAAPPERNVGERIQAAE